MALSFRRLNFKNIEFGRLQARGHYHFASISYKGQPLIVESPVCVTPTGIHDDDSRNWMDVELETASNKDHQLLYDMFKEIDNICIDQSIENREKWFGKNVDEAFIEEQFKSPLTSGWGNDPALLRIEIIAEKPEDMVDADGHVISPRDVSALSEVVLRLHLIGVWASEKFLGTHWRAIGVKAKLPDPKSRFRRSSSPRRIATPPDLNRHRRRHVSEGDSEKPASEKPVSEKSVPAKSDDARRERVRQMLKQMREQKNAVATDAVVPEKNPKVVIEPEHLDDQYSEDDRRRYSSDDDRRSYSDDGRYSSDDDRRRYSDDRRYSSDDNRRRYSSDYDDRRYSDDRYSNDRRRHR